MSAIGGAPGSERLLRPVVVAVLLAVGIACFVGSLLLGAYAPDMRRGGGAGGGGGHALSDAFNGFSGAVALATATGRGGAVLRDPHRLAEPPLLIATPENGTINVDPVVGPRPRQPTLLVLPKWQTVADARNAGWSHVAGLIDPSDPARTLYPATPLAVVQRRSGGAALRTAAAGWPAVTLRAPQPLQAIRPDAGPPRQGHYYGRLLPIVVDARGNIVLGRFERQPLYILADPDLIDNRGLHDPATAAATFALLDRMAGGGAVAFDVTLNGLGHGASPLKLLFEPPFVAVTLSLLVAAMLAALATIQRFGSPRPSTRAIAFGKAALVDNTALLVRRARAEARMGGRYAEVIREAAARAFAVPARQRGPGLDAALDRIGGGRFSGLAAAAAQADDTTQLVEAARRLHDWMEDRGR